MEPKISKGEAKRRFLVHYFTGLPCKRGHISKRYVSTRQCFMCQEYLASIDPKNKETKRNWTKRNYAQQLNSNKWWRDENKELMDQLRRNWLNRNPGYMAIAAHNNKDIRRQATPSWVNQNEIVSIYANCPSGYQVDHIIPIKGKTVEGYRVSGLHVPWNLQYLTKMENIAKNNRMRQQDMELVYV